MKGFFITIEGPDGSGKTTQAKLLVKYFKKNGYNILHTREPGGTAVGEGIRKLLLSTKYKLLPLTEVFLYQAARSQHIFEKIIPSLKQKKIVISERYTDASLAYQGYGRRLGTKLVSLLNKISTNNLIPDLTILLDINPQKALMRIKKTIKDRLEREDVIFHNRVRKFYRFLAKKNPKRIKIVNANKTVLEVHNDILKIIKCLLKI